MLMMAAFGQYRNGFLPNEGGWLDQPMKFGAAMEIIEAASAKVSEKNGNQ